MSKYAIGRDHRVLLISFFDLRKLSTYNTFKTYFKGTVLYIEININSMIDYQRKNVEILRKRLLKFAKIYVESPVTKNVHHLSPSFVNI